VSEHVRRPVVGYAMVLPAATFFGIAAMLEPVVATIVAWLWLREALSAAQLVGAAVVLGGVALAQTAR
jgi:drug/metabolite transporter (DMT)-like permease